MDAGLEVDADAMDVYPNDVPDPRALFPCKVDADGNCLPSCGSVYAYGTGIKAAEMRVRILIELVLYDGVYLDNDYFFLKERLEKVVCNFQKYTLNTQTCMFQG